jgi:hypothetical protein
MGEKSAALEEFSKARDLRPEGFANRWHDEANSPEFKSMLDDKEFLKKLFPPDGVPPAPAGPAH